MKGGRDKNGQREKHKFGYSSSQLGNFGEFSTIERKSFLLVVGGTVYTHMSSSAYLIPVLE